MGWRADLGLSQGPEAIASVVIGGRQRTSEGRENATPLALKREEEL